jgi:hypothetical protein
MFMNVKYPALLVPTTKHLLRLESLSMEVPKATPVITPWTGQQPDDTYNGKPVVDFEGRPARAELAVLWSLNSVGWDGETRPKATRITFWCMGRPLSARSRGADRGMQTGTLRCHPENANMLLTSGSGSGCRFVGERFLSRGMSFGNVRAE